MNKTNHKIIQDPYKTHRKPMSFSGFRAATHRVSQSWSTTMVIGPPHYGRCWVASTGEVWEFSPATVILILLKTFCFVYSLLCLEDVFPLGLLQDLVWCFCYLVVNICFFLALYMRFATGWSRVFQVIHPRGDELRWSAETPGELENAPEQEDLFSLFLPWLCFSLVLLFVSFVFDVCVVFVCLFVCMFVWLTDWLTAWLTDWLTDWLDCCVCGCWFVCFFFWCLVGWSMLIGWLVWLIYRSIGSLMVCLVRQSGLESSF